MRPANSFVAHLPIHFLSTKPAGRRNLLAEFGELSMPLTRGRPLGYDSERMALGFTMLNGGETVECQISGAAMDDLAGGKGTLAADREAQFFRLRDAIEHVASTIFDEKTILEGAVLRVFSKHIRK
jgi:Protein of unknown function (DUF1488)